MNAILVVGKPAGSEVILGVSGCFGRIFSSWLANQPPRRRSNDLRNLLGIRRLSFFVGGGGLRQPERRARTLHGLCGKIKLTLRYGRYPRDRPWAVRFWKPGTCVHARSSLWPCGGGWPSPSAPTAPTPKPPSWPPNGAWPWTTPPCTRWRARQACAPKSKH